MRWFEYNIRSIFYFLYTHTHFLLALSHTHILTLSLTTLVYGFSSIQMVLRISRACFILKYNFDQNFVHFFCCCLFHFAFGRSFFSSHFSTLTLENLQWLSAWSLSFRTNYTHTYTHTHTQTHKGSPSSCMCVFHVIFALRSRWTVDCVFASYTLFSANITTEHNN